MTVTYEAVTKIGRVIHTFSSRDLALKWVRSDAAQQFPGCRVEEVSEQRIVTRRVIGGERLRLVRSA